MWFTCMWQKNVHIQDVYSCADPEDHPSRMEKYKVVDFLRNTGLEPLKSTKLPMSVHRRTTSQAPLK